jgi:hypothetical protein
MMATTVGPVAVEVSGPELAERLATAAGVDEFASPDGGVIVVTSPAAPFAIPPLLPRVVIADHPCDAADVVADGPDLEAVARTAAANPQAATALAVLLRAAEQRPVADGLHAESAVYGLLQAGPEFARWRAGRPRRSKQSPTEPVVGIDRVGDVLRVELRRPDVRNALDAQMRDELADALLLAASDPTLHVELRGAGPTFCAGGDLDEFGSRDDVATAHLVRLSRSLGWIIHQLADRVTVHLHGSCAGSGIELPAFANTVVAAPGTTCSLPEVSLGLVPGAGGTVSLTRRIGRQRTTLLALLGRPIDAATALEWGLVDRIAPS